MRKLDIRQDRPIFDVFHFMIGQDREGHWVAQDVQGRAGGLFVTRDAALRFAEFETDHRTGAIEISPRPIELKL